jgi:hypothetical protein
MIQSKKKSSPVKSVVDSAWEAFFEKESYTETEASLKAGGWISMRDYAQRVGTSTTNAPYHAKRKGLELQHFTVDTGSGRRKTLFMRLPSLKGCISE